MVIDAFVLAVLESVVVVGFYRIYDVIVGTSNRWYGNGC